MKRRTLLIQGGAAVLAAPALVRAQALEKTDLTIAVGGKNLLYDLPLTIAEQRGHFKDEGFDAKIVDFAGGSKALQAFVGGSADVVSGAFEHTVNFGGPMLAGCLYAPQAFIDKHPNTVQALTNAIVRADEWLQNAGAGDITKTVPENYQLGDRAVCIAAFMASNGAMPRDGLFPAGGPETAFKALAGIDPELAKAKLDLSAVYTNAFAQKANAKYPKG